jgi:glycosyltransferase involved in cell wall biosynthesis
MFQGKVVGVVVPAWNESRLIGRVVATMPAFVDHIVVVDDASSDGTADAARAEDSRGIVDLIRQDHNQGVGKALIDGHYRAQELGCDVIAVMAGDAQMSPDDLAKVIAPIVEGRAEYVKGNRLLRPEVTQRMPRYRLVGNAVLTLLSKFAHGYWHSMDPQCGYTAMSSSALSIIPFRGMTRGYGGNAEILYMMNMAGLRVAEVEVEPVYGDEVSYIRLWRYIPTVGSLLARLFISRIVTKYIVRNFHPLALMYVFAALLAFGMVPTLAVRLLVLYAQQGVMPPTTLALLNSSAMFAFMAGSFAIWMDLEDNRVLWVAPPPPWSLQRAERPGSEAD